MANEGHNAAASAAGYIYQTNWALLNLLKEAPGRPDQAIHLEMHDDVSWSIDGSPTELLQTKLHATASASAGLNDKDTDVWKTLLIWLERSDARDPQGPALALVTTSVAVPGTAAYALRPSSTDLNTAMALLDTAATTSEAKATRKGREAYLKLSSAERLSFLARVRVLDASPGLEDLDAGIREALTFALPQDPRQQQRFLAEMWKWWAGVSVDLLQGKRTSVDAAHVKSFIAELRDGFGPESLWTTVHLADVQEQHVERYEESRFVQQMRLVGYPDRNLRRAVIDYHRAITQETDWIDDNLIGLHELDRFETNLRDEWDRAFTDMLDDLATESGIDDLEDLDEATKTKAGKLLLRTLLDSTKITVRRLYDDPFFARGKRHELADRPSEQGGIGWHPQFVSRLKAVIAV